MYKLVLLLVISVVVASCEHNSDDDKSKKADPNVNAAPVMTAGATLDFSFLGNSTLYHYTDWTSADVAGGTANGTITVDPTTNISVDFAAINADGTPGQLFFAQTSSGTNFWIPDTPYISSEVSNAPPDSDILALIGGVNQTYVVTLSQAIKDPIMAIVSLGQPNINVTYNFDTPFTILSQGVGYWGGGPNALTKLDGNILSGNEGHGTIRFIGTYSTFSWVVPNPENWHGFTFAVRTTEANEPSLIDGGITIRDADDSELVGAMVSISDGYSPGDVLTFTPIANIVGNYDDAVGTLSLSGNAVLQDYQLALRSVRYSNIGNDPTVGGSVPNRTITWTVTDADAKGFGAKTSAPVTSSIHITLP